MDYMDYNVILIFALIFLVLIIYVGLYVLVAMMAKHRHREVALWLILSVFISPFIVMIILLCIGDDERYNYIQQGHRNADI